MSRPHVILICADQWRGDCLSVAGHGQVQTPYLDDLARQGTRFSRAYSATPTCVPARAALFTGQSQERHGRVGYVEGVPFAAAHPVTLQGEFRRAGYQTQAIGKMHVWPERSRVGFDDVILHDGYLHHARREHRRQFEFFDDYVPWLRRQPGQPPDADYADHGVHCNSVVTRPWDKEERLHATAWLGSQTIRWLQRRDPTTPFFLYLSFHRPHPPFDPPQWALDQYADLPDEPPLRGDWEHHWDEFRSDGDVLAPFGRVSARTLRRARAGYYGLMSQVDLQVGRIREALLELGLADDTVIAFTSDHGELMGDHDMFLKARPYEGSAHVPFLVADRPSSGVRQPGAVVDQVVELRDLMPTLLDLAGLPVPGTVDGRSLAPYLRGREPAEPVREWLHGEHVYWGQSLQWVTDGKVKYVWGSARGTEELFDLVADPGELHDLAPLPEHAGLRDVWRGRLVQDLTGREEGFVRDGDLVAGRPVVTILEHTRRRLEHWPGGNSGDHPGNTPSTPPGGDRDGVPGAGRSPGEAGHDPAGSGYGQDMITFAVDDIRDWRGHDVVDESGSKVGTLEAIYYDTASEEPTFASVRIGMIGRARLVFVPLEGARVAPDHLRVLSDKKLIKNGPAIDTDGELTAEAEADVFAHFGLEYQPGASGERRLGRR